MDRKFLVMGNPTISHSLIQVMNILTPYEFEHIDTPDFHPLEGQGAYFFSCLRVASPLPFFTTT